MVDAIRVGRIREKEIAKKLQIFIKRRNERRIRPIESYFSLN